MEVVSGAPLKGGKVPVSLYWVEICQHMIHNRGSTLATYRSLFARNESPALRWMEVSHSMAAVDARWEHGLENVISNCTFAYLDLKKKGLISVS